MLKLFSSRLWSWLLATALLGSATACTDTDKKPEPVGALEGSISPATAAGSITATGPDGRTFALTADATGAYQLGGLSAGTYTLTWMATTGFYRPDPVPVSVRAGQTTKVPPVVFNRDGLIRGTMTWTENGQQFTANRFWGQITNDFFSLEGGYADAGGLHSVAMVISFAGRLTNHPFQGAGLYPLGVAEYPFGKVLFNDATTQVVHYTTYANRNVGNVTITSFDAAARRASGTFAFEADPWYNSTSIRSVTNGRFDITY
ncbi:hypothetical protein GCM10027048_17420 [Hymenobacter coalescens]